MTTLMLEDYVRQCACGRKTVLKCHQLWAAPGLIPCNEPICELVGNCKEHRHGNGTMGYITWTKISADYVKDEPDVDTLVERLKSLWRNLFWSNQRKAQRVWDGYKLSVPPPAPLPPNKCFRLSFGKEVYVNVEDKMILEVE